ncbi:MAG: hypothetical protein KC443_25590, partial [Anaerolineales bacterium]|nr:hypothetical protein [Anaerolineales bacterium]
GVRAVKHPSSHTLTTNLVVLTRRAASLCRLVVLNGVRAVKHPSPLTHHYHPRQLTNAPTPPTPTFREGVANVRMGKAAAPLFLCAWSQEWA